MTYNPNDPFANTDKLDVSPEIAPQPVVSAPVVQANPDQGAFNATTDMSPEGLQNMAPVVQGAAPMPPQAPVVSSQPEQQPALQVQDAKEQDLMEKGLKEEASIVEEGANKLADLYSRTQQKVQENNQQKELELQQQQEKINQSLAEVETKSQEFAKMPSKSFWGSKSEANKLGTALAIAFGAMGSSLGGGPNAALQIVNSQIKDFRDTQQAKAAQMQQAVKNSKMTYDMKVKALTAIDQQYAAKELAMYEQLKIKTTELNAKMKGKLASPEMKKQLAEWNREQEAIKQKYAAEQAKAMQAGQKAEMDLRKEYESLQEVKDYKRISDANAKIQGASDNAQGDLAVIFNYMKMLDPNSVVREGEFATAENTGGISDKIRNLYNKTISGERLTPEQRTNFAKESSKLLKAGRSILDKTNEQYRSIAKRYGIDPKYIINTGMEEKEIKVVDGVKYEKVKGGWRKVK